MSLLDTAAAPAASAAPIDPFAPWLNPAPASANPAAQVPAAQRGEDLAAFLSPTEAEQSFAGTLASRPDLAALLEAHSAASGQPPAQFPAQSAAHPGGPPASQPFSPEPAAGFEAHAETYFASSLASSLATPAAAEPAPGSAPAPRGAAPARTAVAGTLLEAVKEELFALETDRIEGKLSQAEYTQIKPAFDLLLRHILERRG